MDEEDLISSLQSHIETETSTPTKTSGMEDERPVPAIIIDDWDTRDLNHHNSARAGEAYGDFNSDGTKTYEWYLNFSFNTRVEFLCRHTDEVDVVSLKDDLKHVIRLIGEKPQDFHSDLKSVTLRRGGEPSYQFTEPKEAEMMLSANFNGDHTVTRTASDVNADVINSINDTFTFKK